MGIDPAALKTLILDQPAGGAVRAAYAAGNDVEAARLLRLLTTDQPALPPMDSSAQLMGLLSDGSLAAVFAHPRFSDFRETFNGGNRAGVIEWAVVFAKLGVISTAEKTAIQAYLMTPVATPTPVVPGVTADDVYRTRGVDQ